MAEWSKAPDLGSGLSRRGFEPHLRQPFFGDGQKIRAFFSTAWAAASKQRDTKRPRRTVSASMARGPAHKKKRRARPARGGGGPHTPRKKTPKGDDARRKHIARRGPIGEHAGAAFGRAETTHAQHRNEAWSGATEIKMAAANQAALCGTKKRVTAKMRRDPISRGAGIKYEPIFPKRGKRKSQTALFILATLFLEPKSVKFG